MMKPVIMLIIMISVTTASQIGTVVWNSDSFIGGVESGANVWKLEVSRLTVVGTTSTFDEYTMSKMVPELEMVLMHRCCLPIPADSPYGSKMLAIYGNSTTILSRTLILTNNECFGNVNQVDERYVTDSSIDIIIHHHPMLCQVKLTLLGSVSQY
jgi:hypothetical protein